MLIHTPELREELFDGNEKTGCVGKAFMQR